MPATAEWGGRWLSKAVAFMDKQGVRTFIDGGKGEGWERGRGPTCRNSTVSSDSQLETGYQWPDQCHLVLSTINFQFQGQFVPISLWLDL